MFTTKQTIETKGASPLAIFTALFNLAFCNKNLHQGIFRNKEIEVDKDAAYNFLNTPTFNWRRFIFHLGRRIYFIIRGLLDDSSEEVLIFDDSTYSRNRSKKVEFLSRVFDHTNMKFIKGFRMLTLGWSDGNSFLGLDFALLSSAEKRIGTMKSILKSIKGPADTIAVRKLSQNLRLTSYRW